ncbi:MAG TPA: protein kinase, partial [Polyangiales bacterium]|nr:protein kinase [Polyangiales bacterium]
MLSNTLPLEFQRTQRSLPAPAPGRASGLFTNVSAAPPKKLGPGSVLGRFELIAKIGAGGMGEVFRAVDRATGHQAAVKVLRAESNAEPTHVQRFRKEARILAEVESPYVASLIEINYDGGYHYIALEFVDGGDLADLLQERGGRLPERDALTIVADVARGLAEAHARGIIHRDIKPQNVMIAHNVESASDRVMVKLCDFGIARALNKREGTLAFTEYDAVLGTPAYMAPEQCSGQVLSPATDIYALGVTLFLLISGRLPFDESETTALLVAHTSHEPPLLADVCSDVSDATAQLVARMLRKSPSDRFVDANALVQAIEGVISGEANAEEVHPLQPASRPDRVVRHVFEWDLRASPDALWPFVSNTDRLNRAVGLPPATFERVQKALGVETSGSNRIAGQSLRWREHPFEWIEGRRWSVLRVFDKGVMRWFTIELELSPKAEGGTHLRYVMTLEPRHALGRLIVALEMRFRQRPALGRTFARIDAYAADGGNAEPSSDAFEQPTVLTNKGRVELARGIAKLREASVPETMIDALGAFCEYAPAQEIAHLRPLAFANLHGLDPDQLVDACLRAANEGLFVLLWQVLCPLCRVPADFLDSLRDLTEHSHCPSCNVDFALDFAQSLELVFR